MFRTIDRQEGPLNGKTAKQIAQMFPDDVTHLLILRRARNLCWIDWHSPIRKPYERSQSQLAFKILQKAIDAEISKAIKGIERTLEARARKPIPETMRRVYLDGAWKPL